MTKIRNKHDAYLSTDKKLREIRVPLPKGALLQIEGIEIENETEESMVSSEGTTCLFYPKARIVKGNGMVIGNKVSIKEFYPKSIDNMFKIKRDNEGKLLVEEETKQKADYIQKKKQFIRGFEKQSELSNSTAMEIATKPWIFGNDKDGYYIISDVNDGASMHREDFKSLNSIFKVSLSLMETFQILFDASYIMYDLKMDNILWVPQPGYTKLIDTDSLIHKNDSLSSLYYNNLYDSPESFKFFEKLYDLKEDQRWGFLQTNRLKTASNIRSLGNLIYELFFGEIPDIGMDVDHDYTLVKKFKKLYKNDPSIDSDEKLDKIAKDLVAFFSKVIRRMPIQRFASAGKMMEEFEKIYALLKIDATDLFTPRSKIIKANGTFAAYNLLQKQPLFQYSITQNEKKYSKVALVGKHSFRREMLSALLSIGQMLDTKIEIHIISDDASKFWEDYLRKNPALPQAVQWKLYKMTETETICIEEKDSYDRTLVDRSLASIQIVDLPLYDNYTDQKLFDDYAYLLSNYIKEHRLNYLLLLHEETEDNLHLLSLLSQEACSNSKNKTCLAYLSDKEDSKPVPSNENLVLFEISSIHASNRYNEHMFEEQIYRMGRMVHAYYCNVMNGEDDFDMESLDRDFRQDIYNIASSERCAIHSLYKIASLGMNPERPGFFKRYYKTIENPEKLEAISWLEHLSWTAYMLTTGAKPASLERMKEYAYQGKNDWKCKEDADHIEHPLLVSSRLGSKLPEDDWSRLTPEDVKNLDLLDQTSYGIYLWYIESKKALEEALCQFKKEWNQLLEGLSENEKQQGLLIGQDVISASKKSIEYMGASENNQDKIHLYEWNLALQEAYDFVQAYPQKHGLEILQRLQHHFRIMAHSYNDRDFKINDDNICWSVLDLLGLY